MEKKLVFCEVCRRDTECYSVIDVDMAGSIKGTTYHYIGKEAHCCECNSLIYLPELNDHNLKALYREYRKENDIIQLEQILEILTKYEIGKRPLSNLLGWGELTLSRYCDGDIPSKQYSDILIKVYSQPEYYAQLLESNKERISSAAYEKSKKAVNAILGSTEITTKINQVIEYILYVCEDITPLALEKALYYIQGFYFAFFNNFIFTEDCEAWVHGPVYREIYNRYKDYHFDPIEKIEGFDASIFSDSEKSILDSVINHLCCYSGKVLEKFTHLEKPWIETRGDLPNSTPSSRIIAKNTIGEYFCAIKDRFEMINPNDISLYAKYMFEQI